MATDTVIIGSIAGDAVDDYVAVAEAMDAAAALPLVELNVSCPNTERGLQFGEDPGALRELQVESLPVNFLHPIDGTPLEGHDDLPVERALAGLCVFRLFNPACDLRAAGGRERKLGAVQPLARLPAVCWPPTTAPASQRPRPLPLHATTSSVVWMQ